MVERFQRIDVLVSNAGIARTGLVADLDIDSWDAMIDINLRGVLHGIAATLPVFRRQGRGRTRRQRLFRDGPRPPGPWIDGGVGQRSRTIDPRYCVNRDGYSRRQFSSPPRRKRPRRRRHCHATREPFDSASSSLASLAIFEVNAPPC